MLGIDSSDAIDAVRAATTKTSAKTRARSTTRARLCCAQGLAGDDSGDNHVPAAECVVEAACVLITIDANAGVPPRLIDFEAARRHRVPRRHPHDLLLAGHAGSR